MIAADVRAVAPHVCPEAFIVSLYLNERGSSATFGITEIEGVTAACHVAAVDDCHRPCCISRYNDELSSFVESRWGFRASPHYPRGSSTITHVAGTVPRSADRMPGRAGARRMNECSGHSSSFDGVVAWSGTMHQDETTYIGIRHSWGGERPFGLLPADRRHHAYVIGKTGTGKTTLLRNLILQDIEAGHGVGVIDPHGDLAYDLLDHIPGRRSDDVVYLDPADTAHPIGLNLLHHVPQESRHLAASSIVAAFKGIWHDSWGPRLEYILSAAVSALLDAEGTTLLGIQRMFTDSRYLSWVVKQIKDPLVRTFWLDEFMEYDDRFLQEAIAPIQNKVGRLLLASPIRNILGQVRSRVNAGFMMDNSRILVANLSKGRLGEDKSSLLGALLVSQFQLAAMARANMPEDQRRDFHLYIDEFQSFGTDAFISILSEARKYRLCLTLSHQYTEQLSDDLKAAVFGNVGTLISFRIGESDGKVLEREFGNGYVSGHFTDLANHEIRVKLLERGEQRTPFLARTSPPNARRYGRREKIIRRSREKYSRPRAEIEEKIARWLDR